MFLSAVIVCLDFADMAAISLPETLKHVDDLVVLTGPADRRTINECAILGVRCIPVPELSPYSGIAKAKAINVGLKDLAKHARRRTWRDWRGLRDWWVLQTDVDIVLPERTRQILDSLNLDRRCLYGTDRQGLKWAGWQREGAPRSQGNLVCTAPRGVWRVGHDDGCGELHWWPLGFFQLWNPQRSGVHAYPTEISLQGLQNRTTDRELASLWPRTRRVFIPELIPAHLLAEDAHPGADWKGRKTRPFAPPLVTAQGY